MKSLRELYKIGRGPSSSHTMGPDRACRIFLEENPEAESFKVILFGSLARTGLGHCTDRAVLDVLGKERTELIFDTEPRDFAHPNTMELYAYKAGEEVAKMRVLSVGGGAIEIEGRESVEGEDIYPENSFAEIAGFCRNNGIRISDYVELREGPEIWDYLHKVWNTMVSAINQGLRETGTLHGGLGVERKAQYLFNKRHIDESHATKENRIVCAFAFAVAEHNADAGVIVTAPTCGACGVVPSALRYMQLEKGFSDEQIVRALAVGGVIGNLVKENASISGAECGCQAEIGTACSMCAAALAELYEMGIGQIEYAAEMAMEHHLGLTCDPIKGLVQIPCIERNAVAAIRAINALRLANFLASTRRISFDMVVETMYETGRDLHRHYRETSQGGLAKLYM